MNTKKAILIICLISGLIITGCIPMKIGRTNPLDAAGSTPVINGNHWYTANASPAFSARYGAAGVVHNGKMWMTGGETNGGGQCTNDVWYSSDGTNWTLATAMAAFPKRYAHAMLSYDGKLWVMGGYDGSVQRNDVYYSSDGVTWTQATASAAWSGRSALSTVVFNNKMWVLGGYSGSYLNSVYWSTDGATWTLATSAAWTSGGRQNASACVYDNKIFVFGGSLPGMNTNDVYSSADGVSWTRLTACSGIAASCYSALVPSGGKMYKIFGQSTWGTFTGAQDDVYSSIDGITWDLITSSAGIGKRTGAVTLLFNGRIWVIAGFNQSGTYLKTVLATD